MAQRNEIHSGSITGSVVVAGSGNTINAKLRAELGNRTPSAADPVDIQRGCSARRRFVSPRGSRGFSRQRIPAASPI